MCLSREIATHRKSLRKSKQGLINGLSHLITLFFKHQHNNHILLAAHSVQITVNSINKEYFFEDKQKIL